MIKRKDNLTDIVEELSKPSVPPPPKEGKNRVVIGNNGELITLTQGEGSKRKVIELSVEELSNLMKSAFELSLDKLLRARKNKK